MGKKKPRYGKYIQLKLAVSYILAHLKQFAAIILVVSIYTSTIFSVQLLRGVVRNTFLELRLDAYGHFSGASFNVDINKVTSEKLLESEAGISSVYANIILPQYDDSIPFGTLDDSACESLGISFKEGRMPQSSEEIALEYQAYVSLRQFVGIGGEIELQLQDSDSEQSKKFILCGLIYDYSDKWKNAFSPIDDYHIPSAIVHSYENLPIFSHAIYSDSYIHKINTTPTYEFWFGGKYYVNWQAINMETAEEQNEKHIIEIITTIATILLCFVIYFGVKNAAQITFNNQHKNLQLLRCVGITPKQTFMVFIYQGLFITLSSIIISAGLGSAILYAAMQVYNTTGNHMNYSFPIPYFLIASGVCFITVMGSYSIQTARILKKPEIEMRSSAISKTQRTKKHRRDTAAKLFHRTIGKSQRRANRLSGALVIITIAVMVTGSYITRLSMVDAFRNDNLIRETTGLDYCYQGLGGGYLTESLKAEVNRAVGVSPENIKAISEKPELDVVLSVVGDYSTTFLLPNENGESSEYLDKLKKERSYIKMYDEMGFDGEEFIAKFGFEKGQDLLEHYVLGVPYSQLEDFSDNLKHGSLDKDKFEDGTQVAVIGTEFNIGDKVKIAILEFAESIDGINDLDDPNLYNPKITTYDATVSAIYDEDVEESRFARLIGRSSSGEALITSDKLMLEADYQLNYSYVWVKKDDDVSAKAAVKEIEDFLLDIFAQCRAEKFQFKNYTNIAEQEKQLAVKNEAPYMFIGGLFLILILTSFLFTTISRSQANAKTYAIMSTIGTSDRNLITMLLRENIFFCIKNIFLGLAISTGVIYILSHRARTEIDMEILLNALKSYGLLFFTSLMIISLAASFFTVRLINSKGTIHTIHTGTD